MWFFRKKETDEQWKKLQVSLTNSFSNIKKDINLLKSKQEENNSNTKEIYKRIEFIEKLLPSTIQQPNERRIDLKEEEITFLNPKSIKEQYDNLTNIQKSILLQLSLLLKESSSEWVAMKILTQEIYPQKKYESVKSMVSNYTDTLLDLGLIEKKRKGRQILLTITEKGYDCLPKQVKLIKKIIKKEG